MASVTDTSTQVSRACSFGYDGATLQHKRDQCCNFAAIRRVVGAEDFTEPAFFVTQFAPQRDKNDKQRKQSAPLRPRDRRAEESEQQPGIDRMAHPTIRAAADQLVALLERHRTAPVASQNHPRADRKRQPPSD